MDSRGIFDAMDRNVSSLHGLRSGRSGYELSVSVSQARKIQTLLRWVNGNAQLADSLTKAGARKVMLQFLSENQRWKLIHDPKFTAGKKLRKKELERKMLENEERFSNWLGSLASQNRWPWDNLDDNDLRNGPDAITESHDYEWSKSYPLE